MDSSDVAIIVFDATTAISHRDIAICHDVLRRGCGAVIALELGHGLENHRHRAPACADAAAGNGRPAVLNSLPTTPQDGPNGGWP